MASEQAMALLDDPMVRTRRRATYNAAEQQFSCVLQNRLQQLLEGKCNVLELLRRYPARPDRLGVMTTPPDLPRNELRLPVVEALIWNTIGFVRADASGGPVSQNVAADGSVTECQVFSTKYPHIVIERTDRYLGDDADPVETSWCLRRVQNQRTQTQFNQLLDVANLVFEVLRAIR